MRLHHRNIRQSRLDVHACCGESYESIGGNSAQGSEDCPELIGHVFVSDADSFPKVLGAADEALHISARVYPGVLIGPAGGFKHQLPCGEARGHRVEARVAYSDNSYSKRQ